MVLFSVLRRGKTAEETQQKHLSVHPEKESKKPFLGICVGMQILFTVSYELGVHKGLGLVEGEVIKISNKKNKEIKIPHIGWNELYPSNDKKAWNNKILRNSLIGKSFYFVHSFICLTKKGGVIFYTRTVYGAEIMVLQGLIWGSSNCGVH